MRKCDWCRNSPECRGVKVSECIVRDYRNFVPYENGGTCRGNRAKMSIYEDAIGMCESCIIHNLEAGRCDIGVTGYHLYVVVLEQRCF